MKLKRSVNGGWKGFVRLVGSVCLLIGFVGSSACLSGGRVLNQAGDAELDLANNRDGFDAIDLKAAHNIDAFSDVTLNCEQGLTQCGGACVDLGIDKYNCGQCSVICDISVQNGGTKCREGLCLFRCFTGWSNEDGSLQNGCEEPL